MFWCVCLTPQKHCELMSLCFHSGCSWFLMHDLPRFARLATMVTCLCFYSVTYGLPVVLGPASSEYLLFPEIELAPHTLRGPREVHGRGPCGLSALSSRVVPDVFTARAWAWLGAGLGIGVARSKASSNVFSHFIFTLLMFTHFNFYPRGM